MKKYIIYHKDSGVIKSVITTSSSPKSDAPKDHTYIECYESTEGMAVDPKTLKLVPAKVNLPYAFTFPAKLRALRNSLLLQTDYTQLPDSPLTADQKAAYQTYRQQLRDLPATYADATSIDEVVFPTEPPR